MLQSVLPLETSPAADFCPVGGFPASEPGEFSSSDGIKQNSFAQLCPWRALSAHLPPGPAGTSCLLSLQSSGFF